MMEKDYSLEYERENLWKKVNEVTNESIKMFYGLIVDQVDPYDPEQVQMLNMVEKMIHVMKDLLSFSKWQSEQIAMISKIDEKIDKLLKASTNKKEVQQ